MNHKKITNKTLRQLCWDCQNTNKIDCEWFDNCEKHPNYCEVDKDGYIVKCDKFKQIIRPKKKDTIKLYYTNRDIAKLLGINERTFYYHKKMYIEKFIKYLESKEV